MTKPSIRSLLIVAASFSAISAANAAPPAKTGTSDKGPILTDARGMSLYTFDKDTEGKSACNGPVRPTGRC
jgi:predicted lipoprotein with Yx(FWY)xxD motif